MRCTPLGCASRKRVNVTLALSKLYCTFAVLATCAEYNQYEKLRKHGIGGKLLGIIGDWLRNRRQRVCIKGKQSTWEEVWSGVPHGSVLGPLLFLIFINDLEDNTSGNVLKFADGTKIFRQVRDVQDNISMQADLDQLVEWAHGRRNRGVQGVHVPPTFSGRGVQEGTLCESLCVSRCAVNGFVPF